VRIERVEDDLLTSAWLGVLDRGDAAILITPLAGASGRLLVREQGEVGGRLDDERLAAAAIVAARERLQMEPLRSGPVCVAGRELFFDASGPPPELVIFGAGPDAVPLARQARDVGFVVTVVDPRAAMLTPDRFPDATLRLVHADNVTSAVPLTARSYVVIMNHHLERDADSLRYALASPAPYVGVLGPRARYARLLARLAEEGRMPAAEHLSRVRNPVGLALGAETPEEIAVSVLGELIALRRGFEGGFLSGRETSLHVPDDRSLFARS
jgi:xanthine/CO dehydrogenase XdhC/CoxF family maturation factor